jgi:hypothetical protein
MGGLHEEARQTLETLISQESGAIRRNRGGGGKESRNTLVRRHCPPCPNSAEESC